MMTLSRDKIEALKDMAFGGATGTGWGIGRHTCQWLKKNGYATNEAYGKKWATLHMTPKGMTLFEQLGTSGAFEWSAGGYRSIFGDYHFRTRRAMVIEG